MVRLRTKLNIALGVMAVLVMFFLVMPSSVQAAAPDNCENVTLLMEECRIDWDPGDGQVLRATKINFELPGVSQQCGDDHYVSGLPCFIIGLYYYFAGVAGILATVMMMWGGIRYITSFGNPAKIAEAKDVIFSALIGLVLTFGAYVILNFINPNVVSLNVPGIGPIERIDDNFWCEDQVEAGATVVPAPPVETCGYPGTITSEGEAQGQKCVFKGVCEPGTECRLNDDNDYECQNAIIEWHGFNLCGNLSYGNLCGAINFADSEDRCTAIKSGSGYVCFAMDFDGQEAQLEHFGGSSATFVVIDPDDPSETTNAYIASDTGKKCGLLYDSAWPTDNVIVGNNCPDARQNCVIELTGKNFSDNYYYGTGGVPDSDAIGAFTNYHCW